LDTALQLNPSQTVWAASKRKSHSKEEVVVFKRTIITSLSFLVFCCVLSLSADAQIPKGNIFVGYSYGSADLNDNTHRSSLNGWEGSLEGKFLPWVGIVADFNGLYGNADFPSSTQLFRVDAREYNFLFGPRVSVSIGKIRPFAHALFGAGHVNVTTAGYSASDTAFASALGGGLDYHLVPLVAWRFQGDYLQTRFFGNRQDNGRFSTGIVLNF
jgi:Outer membrane protein beta-barrel domain